MFLIAAKARKPLAGFRGTPSAVFNPDGGWEY